MPTSKLRKLQEATIAVVWLVFLPCHSSPSSVIFLKPKAAVSNLSMYQKDPEGLFKHLVGSYLQAGGWEGSEGFLSKKVPGYADAGPATTYFENN